jgi:hypothetical protein
MLREINIRKPPARTPRAKPSLPMTGGPRPSLTPRRPNWVRWSRAPNGVSTVSRIPGFMNETAPRGHVVEGSPEEAEMKRELGL